MDGETRIVCRKTFSGRARTFSPAIIPAFPLGARRVAVRSGHAVRGHPAVGLLLAAGSGQGAGGHADERRPLQADGRPGETIDMEVELTERLADAFFLKAKVSVAGKVAVRFEFACTLANWQPQTYSPARPRAWTFCNWPASRS